MFGMWWTIWEGQAWNDLQIAGMLLSAHIIDTLIWWLP